VSPNSPPQALERQVAVLKAYCLQRGWNYKLVQDCGSSLNYRNSGLVRLLKLICSQQVQRLVLANRDRLPRLGSELLFSLCEIFATEVILVNCAGSRDFEEDLSQDLQEIVDLFTARLYGSRNSENREIVKQLQAIAKQLKPTAIGTDLN
jgi:predicted site-specific integrase-resolvase